MIKNILFDFDGTLVNNDGLYDQLWPKLVANLPTYAREQLAGHHWSEYRAEGWRELFKRLKLSFWQIWQLSRWLQKESGQLTNYLQWQPEIPAVLTQLIANYELGILTSNRVANVKKFLAASEQINFKFIASAALFNKGRQINKLLARHHWTKADTIYIGDQVEDIVACQEVALPVVGVTWGWGLPAHLAIYQPNFLVNQPRELLDLLANLNQTAGF